MKANQHNNVGEEKIKFPEMEALNMEEHWLEHRQQCLYQEEEYLENSKAYLAHRESLLLKEKEAGQDYPGLRGLLRRETVAVSVRYREFIRQEKILQRERHHFLLKKERLQKQVDEVTSLQTEVQSLQEASQMLRSALAEEKLTYQKEIEDIAGKRKTFQKEKEELSLEADIFKKQRSEHRMHRKAFSAEKEKIANEREDFKLEASEMAMLRKAYLKERRDIELKREGFQKEEEHFRLEMDALKKKRKVNLEKDRKLDQKNSTTDTMKTGLQVLQKAKESRTIALANVQRGKTVQDNGSATVDSSQRPDWPDTVWPCRDEWGRCGCRARFSRGLALLVQ